MTTATAAASEARVARLSAAIPIVTVFVWAALVHGWQAWSIATPWLFTDELEHAQIARSIAETGHPARRGVEYPFLTSLYAYFIAPAWLFADTATAYGVAKFLGAVVMSAAALPAYGLARLLVSRPAAIFAAVATVSIPAFMYTGLLIQEPLAYFFSTLALYLIVRSLVRRRPRDVILAVAAVTAAPFVRSELAVLVPVYVAGALAVAFRTERARRWRAQWSGRDWAAAALLVIGALVVVNGVLAHESVAWHVATRHYKDRIADHILWAGGAQAIGIGVLPFVAGLAALRRPRGEPPLPALPAFAATFLASLLVFGAYTGVKGAYVSTTVFTRVAERNLIYLAPLFFVATALWLERPRLRPVALALAAGFTVLLLRTTLIQLEYPYFEAPGYSILALANREAEIAAETIREGLLGVFAVAGLLALLPAALARRPRLRWSVLVTSAVLVVAWNLVGEVGAVKGSRTTADAFAANLPRPLDWVDEATGGAPAVYVAQAVEDETGIWSHEFWNRSIRRVWSLDGSAPGPGPTVTPDLARADGTLVVSFGEYAVTEAGVELVGPVVANRGAVRVVRLGREMRLRSLVEGVASDGWMGAASAYSRFSTPGGRAGILDVSVSRVGGGADLHAEVEILVGRLIVNDLHHPAIGRVTERRAWAFGNKDEPARVFSIPTPPAPFRVEVRVDPTFVPAELDPRSGDRRSLGAQVGFAFRAGS